MDQDINQPAPDQEAKELPIINCHVHIFTGDHVAPYLAKSIVRTPLWLFVNFNWVFLFCRWWYGKLGPYRKRFTGKTKARRRGDYERQMLLKRSFVLGTLYFLVGSFFTLQALDFIMHWIYGGTNPGGWIFDSLRWLHQRLASWNILLETKADWARVLLILLVLLFYKSGRNLIFFLLKQTLSFLKKIPGKQTKELFQRYLLIGRYTFHRKQSTVLDKLAGQYPEKTGFVVLPMDMKYMDAGKLKVSYKDQMSELAALKAKRPKQIYPFVFVDPRRMKEEGKAFFDYEVKGTTVELKECFIKEYIETNQFSGFKIYPALGYYPFDPLLLPLWKYAAQKKLPILTHCVRGPMYFRGSKQKAWDYHPVFKQAMGNGVYDPLLLPEIANDKMATNFTHPMNFLCLLKKELLAETLAFYLQSPAADTRLREIFRYSDPIDGKAPTVGVGLDDLKICFGHYGGGDEWLRFLEKDRNEYSAELIENPKQGLNFLYYKGKNQLAPGKPEELWKYADWYTIISSVILQHPNVYADISYILHDDAAILPLLKQTLQNPQLREKILYGTDFYVVRNHKSDKHMLAEMMGGLEKTDFDQLARKNPRIFLNI
jgi:predicted TIM-barrel fold metal-dependent hydrolase